MEYLTRIGYVVLCLLVPAAWGLFVEWLFHVSRTRRGGRAGPDSPAPATGAPHQRGGQ